MNYYLKVNGVNYQIDDTVEKMTVPDCFVVTSNKIGSGSGEAKFYIGNESKHLRAFFGSSGFTDKCFLLKKDVLEYLNDVKDEYLSPEQEYRQRNNLPNLWETRVKHVEKLDSILWFDIFEKTNIAKPRIYIKSNDTNYSLIRELSLPNITYLSAIKLRGDDGSILFYFKLFIDYFGGTEHQKKAEKEIENIAEKHISEEKKSQIYNARIGQGKYRNALLEECPYCPITLVSDDRLLIASHIKPWSVSTDKEKIDPKNGLMLTPTYDFLFDRGFITFSDEKKMLISPWLSKLTCKRLDLVNERVFTMIPIEGRASYLKYHRENLFKQ